MNKILLATVLISMLCVFPARAHNTPDPAFLVAGMKWCAVNRPDMRNVEADVEKHLKKSEREFFAAVRAELKKYPPDFVTKQVSESDLQSYCDGLQRDLNQPGSELHRPDGEN